jgi:hypothetical protein
VTGVVETGGERVGIESALRWVDDLIEEAAGGELRDLGSGQASLSVCIESANRPFGTAGWEPLTRGAWRNGHDVVVEDVCSSGFDLRLSTSGDSAEFTFRWRPALGGQAVGLILRSRFILLARAALFQYPALWWSAVRGRAPLHASAFSAGNARPLLAGPAGVGKSTLMVRELAAGGRAICDNLCVSDGMTAWGVVEPLRVEGGLGRSMPHGRAEVAWNGRLASLEPDRVVVLRRGVGDFAHVRPCDTATIARSLITGTYMAGELRRFWSLAATLTAGTGLGPPHPPVAQVAHALASRLPGVEISLPRRPGVRLMDLLSRVEAIA